MDTDSMENYGHYSGGREKHYTRNVKTIECVYLSKR